jgi:hypothetical protein
MKRFAVFLNRSLFAAVAGLLTLGLSAFAATPAHADTAKLTTVSGVVTLDGKPLSGATVCVGAPVYQAGKGYVDDAGACVSTDAKGAFTKSFSLSATSTFATVWVEAGANYPRQTADSYRNDLGGYFTINPGDSITKKVAVRSNAKPTTVSGVVTLDGKPLSGATVCVGAPVYQASTGYVDAAGTCVSTNAKGAYSYSFLLSVSSTMATVGVKAGANYPDTTAGAYRNNIGGYFTINPGDSITKNIAVKSTTKRSTFFGWFATAN